MKYFITGGCGFLGSNLSAEVLRRGDELFVFDNLSRFGSAQNLEWLKSLGSLRFFHGDIRSYNDVEYAIKSFMPDVVFHLAGQVAMTTSIDNPRFDFEVNVIGGINILEIVRKYSPYSTVSFSSTNKVYGELENLDYVETNTRYIAKDFENGFDETIPLDFKSPYGCSKGAIDQYMQDYFKTYGLRTVTFRHSSIFGERQFSTFDQGWIGWFISQAIQKKKFPNSNSFTISGNGKQVRDVLFSSDLVSCYFSAIAAIDQTAGKVYNIGGGIENSLSLIELFTILENRLNIKLEYERLAPRQSDQKIFVANIKKARADFNWAPKVSKLAGLNNMIDWLTDLK